MVGEDWDEYLAILRVSKDVTRLYLFNLIGGPWVGGPYQPVKSMFLEYFVCFSHIPLSQVATCLPLLSSNSKNYSWVTYLFDTRGRLWFSFLFLLSFDLEL